MPKTRQIRRRITAVGNIQRITKTMQMIATARFQAAQRRATMSKPYTRKIGELVGELAAALASERAGGSGEPQAAAGHPLLAAPRPAVNRELLLVITSNRGLCGGYNGGILRQANSLLRQAGGTAIDLEVVGKKGANAFKFLRQPVAAYHSDLPDQPTYPQIEALADRYMREFTGGRYDAVRVVFMAFHSMSRQSPQVLTLLPMQDPTRPEQAPAAAAVAPAGAAERSPRAAQYDFTPGAGELLAQLLPETVRVRLFQAFNEAVVGEQIARMVAMKSATDAAGRMRKDLTRRYNRARQTAITTELSEIIGGAAALQ